MNYQDLTTKFRELARDLLRLKWINNVMDNILYAKNRISEIQKCKDNSIKEIKKIEYRLSKLEEIDPEYKEKTESFNMNIAVYEEKIKKDEQEIETINKLIQKEQEDMQKIETGELKVNAENLSTKTKELADAYVKHLATQVEKE